MKRRTKNLLRDAVDRAKKLDRTVVTYRITCTLPSGGNLLATVYDRQDAIHIHSALCAKAMQTSTRWASKLVEVTEQEVLELDLGQEAKAAEAGS